MYRLTTHHHLYRAGDAGWRYADADGRIVRMRAPDGVPEALLQTLDGPVASQPAAGGPADGTAWCTSADVRELAAALEARGVLQRCPPATDDPATGSGEDPDLALLPRPAAARPVVLVQGDGPVVERVLELLGVDADARPVGSADHPGTGLSSHLDGAAVQAVVSVAGHLPDEAWLRTEDGLAGSDVVWQRCYQEGRRFVVGPVRRGRDGPGYRDTRGRLLAASPDVAETLALWAHLSQAEPPPPPERAWASMVAGLVVAGVRSALGEQGVGSGVRPAVQHVLDPVDLRLTSHPVLPLPSTEVLGG